MDAVNVSIRKAANDQVAALGHRKAIDRGVKAEKLAVVAGFLLEKHQTFVYRQHDALILQGGKDARVFDALEVFFVQVLSFRLQKVAFSYLFFVRDPKQASRAEGAAKRLVFTGRRFKLTP